MDTTRIITFNVNDLKKAVSRVGSVVSANAVLPVLSCVLVEVGGDEAIFTGTNLQETLSCPVPVQGSNSRFTMAIDHKHLSDLCKVLPNAPVEMEYDTAKLCLTARCDGSVHTLGTLPVDEFPKAPEVMDSKDAHRMRLPVGALAKMKIAATVCSKDTLRPAMTGVLFVIKDNHISFVSTDAHRLYESEALSLGDEVVPDAEWFVVPKSAIDNLVGMDVKTDMGFAYNKSHAIFTTKEFTLSLRLIDARFPDYNAVKPDNQFHFTTEGNTLRNTLKIVAISANKTTNQVVFDLASDKLTITAQDIDNSTASRKDLNVIQKGEDIKIAFNAALLDQLLGCAAGEPTIKYQTPTRAAVISGSENKDYFLLMPLMVGV